MGAGPWWFLGQPLFCIKTIRVCDTMLTEDETDEILLMLDNTKVTYDRVIALAANYDRMPTLVTRMIRGFIIREASPLMKRVGDIIQAKCLCEGLARLKSKRHEIQELYWDGVAKYYHTKWCESNN